MRITRFRTAGTGNSYHKFFFIFSGHFGKVTWNHEHGALIRRGDSELGNPWFSGSMFWGCKLAFLLQFFSLMMVSFSTSKTGLQVCRSFIHTIGRRPFALASWHRRRRKAKIGRCLGSWWTHDSTHHLSSLIYFLKAFIMKTLTTLKKCHLYKCFLFLLAKSCDNSWPYLFEDGWQWQKAQVNYLDFWSWEKFDGWAVEKSWVKDHVSCGTCHK